MMTADRTMHSPSPKPSPARRRTTPPGLTLPPHPLVIGVLALQGAFREHITLLHKAARLLDLPSSSSPSFAHASPSSGGGGAPFSFNAILVRSSQDLAACHALIIPGGESTAIAFGVQRAGMLDDLRSWVANDRPTWGTCAGMIMLAREASGGKRGGQELIGGMDCRVGRNGFGSQVDSFETQLEIPVLGPEPFPAVFIRAPIVDCLLSPETEAEAAANGHASSEQKSSTFTQTRATETTGALPLVIAPSLRPYRTTQALTAQEAPSIANGAGASRPPLQILASLPAPITPPPLPQQQQSAHRTQSRSGADDSPSASPTTVNGDDDADGDGGDGALTPRGAHAELAPISLPRPSTDTQIVALRQGNLVATSFHPELTVDARLHAWFIRDIVLPALIGASAKPAA